MTCEYTTNWKHNVPLHRNSAHPKNCKRFNYHLCDKVYSKLGNLRRHLKNIHKESKFTECNSVFHSSKEFCLHMKIHLNQTFNCDDYRIMFGSREKLSLHKKSRDCGQIRSSSNLDFEGNLELSANNPIELIGKAFKSFVKLYTLLPKNKFQDPKQLILHYQNDFNELFSKLLSTDSNIKAQLCFQILFEKSLEINEDNGRNFKTIENIAYFCPFPSIINHVDSIETLSIQVLEVENRIDSFVNQGSFWNVN